MNTNEGDWLQNASSLSTENTNDIQFQWVKDEEDIVVGKM